MQPAKKRIINSAFSGPKLGKIIMPHEIIRLNYSATGKKKQDAGPLEVRARFHISESGWNAAKTVLTSKNRLFFSPIFLSGHFECCVSLHKPEPEATISCY